MSVPTTFPAFLFGMVLDVVYRKITGCKPPDIESDSDYWVWIAILVEITRRSRGS